MVALGVFKPQARYLVPVGGMVIGNAMTAAAVALNRLGDDVGDGAAQLEATWRSAPPRAKRCALCSDAAYARA